MSAILAQHTVVEVINAATNKEGSDYKISSLRHSVTAQHNNYFQNLICKHYSSIPVFKCTAYLCLLIILTGHFDLLIAHQILIAQKRCLQQRNKFEARQKTLQIHGALVTTTRNFHMDDQRKMMIWKSLIEVLYICTYIRMGVYMYGCIMQ